jgi:polyhydroxyalkanoate synthase
MMPPINIKPDQAVQELMEFTKKLSKGVNTLGKIGEVDVGTSPRVPVYREDRVVVYHYLPKVGNPHPIPLLIVYALVNRPYMMDLEEGRSLIQGLLEAGIDVYLVDWGYANDADRYVTLEDYVSGYIRHCVDYVRSKHNLAQINLLGVCQGGTLSLCFSALYPERVKNLIPMVTPVDFHTPDNQLTHLVKNLDVDLLVHTLGNVPGEMLNFLFLSLNPFRLTGQKYVDLVDILEDEAALKNFLRMEKWIFDSPDQAGEAFRQFIKQFFQDNKLIKGEAMIGERRVSLKDITMPVLNVYANKDHLVPPLSSQALKNQVGSSDYSELSFKGGHIGIYVSGRSQREVPPTIANWLKERG